MKKMFLFFFLILFYKTTLPAQDQAIVMGILPVQKSKTLPEGVGPMLENMILDKVRMQQRFKLVKAGDVEADYLMPGSTIAVEAGNKAGATHLVQFTIQSFSFTESKIPEKFDQDFKLDMDAAAAVETKIMDVATGEIVDLYTTKEKGGIFKLVSKIEPEKAQRSREKGLYFVKKTEKELKDEHNKMLKQIEDWRREAHQKVIERTANSVGDRFERVLMPELAILEIVEEKKGKAYKVVLPFVKGMEYNKKEYFKVKQTTYLEFNGEKVAREEKIGGIKFLEVENGKAVFKVYSGKEEIYEAMQKSEKLICEYE